MSAVTFTLNKPQAKALLVNAKETWVMAGRGSGKTQGISARWAKHKTDVMPRSTGAVIGQSFTDLEVKILGPIFEGWLMMGLEIENHYVYGRKPFSDWDKALTPVLDYKRVISFPNGSNIQLVSLHQKGSANSKSFQYVFGPEAKFFNEYQLRDEVFPAIRGHKKYFDTCPWYGAMLFETDKYSTDISWLLAKRKLHNEKIVQAVLYYQLLQNEEKMKLVTCSDSHAFKVRQKINKLEYIMGELRKRLVYVSEFNAMDNLTNLPSLYIEEKKRTMTDYEFRIAIMNEDPTKVENGFYPNRTEKNSYHSDIDQDYDKPLAIAMDYQASISPLVWAQVNDRVIPGMQTLNVLGSMYSLQPLGLKHTIDDFCKLHVNRPCKHAFYFYDHTAVGERNMHKKFYEEVIDYFAANGWTITGIYMGQAPLQSNKYNRINYYLSDESTKPVMFHKEKCASLLLSMDMTGTEETPQGTKKDKSKERDKRFPQEQAPHLGDTFDMLIWGILELNKYPSTTESEGMFGVR